MTGLEKILDRIKSESDSNIKAIISDAEEKCREIKLSAEQSVDDELAEQEKQNALLCEQIIQRAKSSAEHTAAQNLLRRKREVIGEVIKQAEEAFLKLPVDEYFDAVSRLLEKNASGTGEIIFNKADKERLPSGFDLRGNKVSDRTGDFSGGFILDYGDIEINCTVSALFRGAYDELSDMVNGLLFRGV